MSPTDVTVGRSPKRAVEQLQGRAAFGQTELAAALQAAGVHSSPGLPIWRATRRNAGQMFGRRAVVQTVILTKIGQSRRQ